MMKEQKSFWGIYPTDMENFRYGLIEIKPDGVPCLYTYELTLHAALKKMHELNGFINKN